MDAYSDTRMPSSTLIHFFWEFEILNLKPMFFFSINYSAPWEVRNDANGFRVWGSKV